MKQARVIRSLRLTGRRLMPENGAGSAFLRLWR